ncbi:hypothetical protein [Embleya sp. NPDC005971]|uniref:hypothetical protein n=1 Tax=Embleya sp. NPDC005971 TaxID=3156724 RepID=UPI00340921AF
MEGVPVTEVKPEEIGVLSLRYVDGQPQLVVSGGKAIPSGLAVVDAAGNAVAAYSVGPILEARQRQIIGYVTQYDGWKDIPGLVPSTSYTY